MRGPKRALTNWASMHWSKSTTRENSRLPWTRGPSVIGVNNRNLRTLARASMRPSS